MALASGCKARMARPRAKKPSAFLPLVEATEAQRPPSGPGWVHEIKWDGYRVQAHLARSATGAGATIYTRNGHDWTDRFPTIAAAIARLRATSAVLDGEAVVVDDAGVADFGSLRRQLGDPYAPVLLKAFDLLQLDGEDLRPLPWAERNARLRDLLVTLPAPAARTIAWVEPLEGDGPAVLAGACRLGLEGIVSKRVESPYRGGRSDSWRKVKCARSDTFIVVGYSENARGRIDGLYLGRAGPGGSIRYAGQVENGFGAGDLAELGRRLKPIGNARSPLAVVPKDKRKAKWVRPQVLVEIAFPNTTADGRLRHPSFKGFRDDLLKDKR